MPVLQSGRDQSHDEGDRIELTGDTPDLQLFKTAIEEVQADASDYFNRNQKSWSWWHSRWDGQTSDGLKWGRGDGDQVWPWEGSSDTRVGLVAKVMRDHGTIAKYALMNMKVQAKSSRPFATQRDSQQATTLINWMLFTHMLEEVTNELPLLVNWRNGFGSAVLWTDWEQERQVDYIPISMMALQQFANMQSGQNQMLDYFQSAISDPTQTDDLASIIQMMSPIVTKPQARGIVKDLRELRTANIPIPYVYKSKPRWTALRSMVDILWSNPLSTSDLQKARWISRFERVTESELVDRIETDGYSKDFVDEALDHRGLTRSERWANRNTIESDVSGRYNWYASNRQDFDDKIELNHFYYKTVMRGVPCVYRTVFHMDVETPGKHGPYGYKHGKYPCDAFRLERHERAIVSSRGIPEQMYTWEQEVKKQRDGRTDFTDLKLRPPLIADYKDVLRIKQTFSPGVVFPFKRGTEASFMPMPSNEQSSIEIEQSINQMVSEYTGLFGVTIDPMLKQLRQQEVADDLLLELKRPVMQLWQLTQQYLPDEQVTKIVGPLQRPFHVSREQIQGAYDFTMTVDMRELDKDFMKEKMNAVRELMTWDKAGTIDSTGVIRRMFEGWDYTLADEAIQNPDAASRKEQEDERRAVREIVGSGMEPELPQGANNQLRLQTLMQEIQEASQKNPIFQKKVKETPEILQVLANRKQYFERQLQQQQNAQIGRIQTAETFGKNAPNMALPSQ